MANNAEVKFRHNLPVINLWGAKRLHEEMEKIGRNQDLRGLADIAMPVNEQIEVALAILTAK